MKTPIERVIDMDDEAIFGNANERQEFLRRLGRAAKLQPRSYSTPDESFYDALHVDTNWDSFPFSIENLSPLAEESVTAQRLLTSALYAARGMQALAEGMVEIAAKALSVAYLRNSLVVRWEMKQVNLARVAFRKLARQELADSTDRSHAFHVLAQLDFVQGQMQRGLENLFRAQRLSPTDPRFVNVEGCIWAILLQENRAYVAFSKASSMGSDDIEHTLFHRAVVSRGGHSATLRLLSEFVEQAEKDDRKLPEANYRLALLHGLMGPKQIGIARRYLDAGIEADRVRLPCFPDAAAEQRAQAMELLKGYHPCGRPECTLSGNSICARCRRTYYCSRECQKQHWSTHKQTCEKANK